MDRTKFRHQVKLGIGILFHCVFVLAPAIFGLTIDGAVAQESIPPGLGADRKANVIQKGDRKRIGKDKVLPEVLPNGDRPRPIGIYASQLVELVPPDYRPINRKELFQNRRQDGGTKVASMLPKEWQSDQQLVSATYEANYQSHALVEGTATWSFRHSSDGAFQLELPEVSLLIDVASIRCPMADEISLVTLPNGTVQFIGTAPEGNLEISFRWSHRSLPSRRGDEFRLKLPTATVASLQIHSISKHQFDVQNGTIQETEDGVIIRLGSLPETRLLIAPNAIPFDGVIESAIHRFQIGRSGVLWSATWVYRAVRPNTYPGISIQGSGLTGVRLDDGTPLEFRSPPGKPDHYELRPRNVVGNAEPIDEDNPLKRRDPAEANLKRTLTFSGFFEWNDRIQLPSIRPTQNWNVAPVQLDQLQLLVDEGLRLNDWQLPEGWKYITANTSDNGLFPSDGLLASDGLYLAVGDGLLSIPTESLVKVSINAPYRLKKRSLATQVKGPNQAAWAKYRFQIQSTQRQLTPIYCKVQPDWEVASVRSSLGAELRFESLPNDTIRIWPSSRIWSSSSEGFDEMTIDVSGISSVGKPIDPGEMEYASQEIWFLDPDIESRHEVPLNSSVRPPAGRRWTAACGSIANQIKPNQLDAVTREFLMADHSKDFVSGAIRLPQDLRGSSNGVNKDVDTDPKNSIADFRSNELDQILVFQPTAAVVEPLSTIDAGIAFDATSLYQIQYENDQLTERFDVQVSSAGRRLPTLRLRGASSESDWKWYLVPRTEDNLSVTQKTDLDPNEGIPVTALREKNSIVESSESVWRLDAGDLDFRVYRLVGVGTRKAKANSVADLSPPSVLDANETICFGKTRGPIGWMGFDSGIIPSVEESTFRYFPDLPTALRLRLGVLPMRQSIVDRLVLDVTASVLRDDHITLTLDGRFGSGLRVRMGGVVRLLEATKDGKPTDVDANVEPESAQSIIEIPPQSESARFELHFQRAVHSEWWGRQCRMPTIDTNAVVLRRIHRFYADRGATLPATWLQQMRLPRSQSKSPSVGGKSSSPDKNQNQLHGVTVGKDASTLVLRSGPLFAMAWPLAMLLMVSSWLIARRHTIHAIVALLVISVGLWVIGLEWSSVLLVAWIPFATGAVLSICFDPQAIDNGVSKNGHADAVKSSNTLARIKRYVTLILTIASINVFLQKPIDAQPPFLTIPDQIPDKNLRPEGPTKPTQETDRSNEPQSSSVAVLIPVDQTGAMDGDIVYVPKTVSDEILGTNWRERDPQFGLGEATKFRSVRWKLFGFETNSAAEAIDSSSNEGQAEDDPSPTQDSSTSAPGVTNLPAGEQRKAGRSLLVRASFRIQGTPVFPIELKFPSPWVRSVESTNEIDTKPISMATDPTQEFLQIIGSEESVSTSQISQSMIHVDLAIPIRYDAEINRSIVDFPILPIADSIIQLDTGNSETAGQWLVNLPERVTTIDGFQRFHSSELEQGILIGAANRLVLQWPESNSFDTVASSMMGREKRSPSTRASENTIASAQTQYLLRFDGDHLAIRCQYFPQRSFIRGETISLTVRSLVRPQLIAPFWQQVESDGARDFDSIQSSFHKTTPITLVALESNPGSIEFLWRIPLDPSAVTEFAESLASTIGWDAIPSVIPNNDSESHTTESFRSPLTFLLPVIGDERSIASAEANVAFYQSDQWTTDIQSTPQNTSQDRLSQQFWETWDGIPTSQNNLRDAVADDRNTANLAPSVSVEENAIAYSLVDPAKTEVTLFPRGKTFFGASVVQNWQIGISAQRLNVSIQFDPNDPSGMLKRPFAFELPEGFQLIQIESAGADGALTPLRADRQSPRNAKQQRFRITPSTVKPLPEGVREIVIRCERRVSFPSEDSPNRIEPLPLLRCEGKEFDRCTTLISTLGDTDLAIVQDQGWKIRTVNEISSSDLRDGIYPVFEVTQPNQSRAGDNAILSKSPPRFRLERRISNGKASQTSLVRRDSRWQLKFDLLKRREDLSSPTRRFEIECDSELVTRIEDAIKEQYPGSTTVVIDSVSMRRSVIRTQIPFPTVSFKPGLDLPGDEPAQLAFSFSLPLLTSGAGGLSVPRIVPLGRWQSAIQYVVVSAADEEGILSWQAEGTRQLEATDSNSPMSFRFLVTNPSWSIRQDPRPQANGFPVIHTLQSSVLIADERKIIESSSLIAPKGNANLSFKIPNGGKMMGVLIEGRSVSVEENNGVYSLTFVNRQLPQRIQWLFSVPRRQKDIDLQFGKEVPIIHQWYRLMLPTEATSQSGDSKESNQGLVDNSIRESSNIASAIVAAMELSVDENPGWDQGELESWWSRRCEEFRISLLNAHMEDPTKPMQRESVVNRMRVVGQQYGIPISTIETDLGWENLLTTTDDPFSKAPRRLLPTDSYTTIEVTTHRSELGDTRYGVMRKPSSFLRAIVGGALTLFLLGSVWIAMLPLLKRWNQRIASPAAWLALLAIGIAGMGPALLIPASAMLLLLFLFHLEFFRSKIQRWVAIYRRAS